MLEPNDTISQGRTCGPCSLGLAPIRRRAGCEMKKASGHTVDLLVVVDPYPSATAAWAAMPHLKVPRSIRTAPSTCFPPARSSRRRPLVAASGRSVQWREKVIEPLFESRTDHAIMLRFAQKWALPTSCWANRNGKQNIRTMPGAEAGTGR